MNISTNWEPHDNLERDVGDFLQGMQFLIASAAYHKVFPIEVTRRLQTIYTPTALYFRSRADNIAVHRSLDLVFEWECKTHTHPDLHDMTVEALPILHHLLRAELDVATLYVYHDPLANPPIECGFWIENLPEIREIRIPTRWSQSAIDWFASQFRNWLPSVHQVQRACAGSGDPFMIIDEGVLRNLAHWKTLIEQRMKEDDA